MQIEIFIKKFSIFFEFRMNESDILELTKENVKLEDFKHDEDGASSNDEKANGEDNSKTISSRPAKKRKLKLTHNKKRKVPKKTSKLSGIDEEDIGEAISYSSYNILKRREIVTTKCKKGKKQKIQKKDYNNKSDSYKMKFKMISKNANQKRRLTKKRLQKRNAAE